MRVRIKRRDKNYGAPLLKSSKGKTSLRCTLKHLGLQSRLNCLSNSVRRLSDRHTTLLSRPTANVSAASWMRARDFRTYWIELSSATQWCRRRPWWCCCLPTVGFTTTLILPLWPNGNYRVGWTKDFKTCAWSLLVFIHELQGGVWKHSL